jgi:protein ImuB
MQHRYVAIWFCYLKTDWFVRKQPELKKSSFILAAASHGRMMVTAANALAENKGIYTGTVVADAKAMLPSLQVLNDEPGLEQKLLTALAEWFIRYTPIVAIDLPDGLILDATGCCHLWGGEEKYIIAIAKRLNEIGYQVKIAVASTIGTAWAICRFGKNFSVIENNKQADALYSLPPQALRLEAEVVERLHKLGLKQIKDFIAMPRAVLSRRFGKGFIKRLNQALGHDKEFIQSVILTESYSERLSCLEPIVTATGIEIALQRLLETLCKRLQQDQKGLRTAIFKNYRIDGKIETIQIGTNRPSQTVVHLFELFEINIATIEPALGIELFTLEATKVEDLFAVQEKLWNNKNNLDNKELSQLLDRIGGRFGNNNIQRYLPDEHYWPERSIKLASSINEKTQLVWKTDKPRPIKLLPRPELIEVTAPIPDYPPMLFRYKGKLHKIVKADGPERIEQEWWLQQGRHRDYYYVEDEEGCRYWLFRSGHYDDTKLPQWFIHGFFA